MILDRSDQLLVCEVCLDKLLHPGTWGGWGGGSPSLFPGNMGTPGSYFLVDRRRCSFYRTPVIPKPYAYRSFTHNWKGSQKQFDTDAPLSMPVCEFAFDVVESM